MKMLKATHDCFVVCKLAVSVCNVQCHIKCEERRHISVEQSTWKNCLQKCECLYRYSAVVRNYAFCAALELRWLSFHTKRGAKLFPKVVTLFDVVLQTGISALLQVGCGRASTTIPQPISDPTRQKSKSSLQYILQALPSHQQQLNYHRKTPM